MQKQKIIPHLWFDKEAKEAAGFYQAVFKDGSKIISSAKIYNTPSGTTDIVSFTVLGYEFMAISAGPLFKINPSISFHVTAKTMEDVDKWWNLLVTGGKIMMPVGEYPFSKRYGWLEDKFGVSWQLIYTDKINEKQRITPVLMFTDKVFGKTEEAVKFYASILRHSSITHIQYYTRKELPNQQDAVKYVDFMLEGQKFGAMDGAGRHEFKFNEAISLIVNCETQAEIDYYWDKLSAVPEAEQCGWLKDKYGLSWQITPTVMNKMMAGGTREQIDRVTQAFLPMKKFDIAKLQQAYDGKS